MENEKENPKREGTAWIWRSVVLLVCYLTVAIWAFREMTTWPSVGHWELIIYIFLFPAFIKRLIHLFYFRLRKKRLEGKGKRISVFMISVIAGLFLIGPVNILSNKIAMKKFQSKYAPLVAQLQAEKNDLCRNMSDFIQTRKLEGIKKPKALYYNNEFFILSFFGGSVDIDGSTITYNSKTGQWDIFHNQTEEKIREIEEITKDMQNCNA